LTPCRSTRARAGRTCTASAPSTSAFASARSTGRTSSGVNKLEIVMLLLRTVGRGDDLGVPVGQVPAGTCRCRGSARATSRVETVGARHRWIDHERELCQPPGHVAALHLERVPCSWRAARNDRKTLDSRVCAMRGAVQNAGSCCIMHGTAAICRPDADWYGTTSVNDPKCESVPP